ncbi:MAG: PrsW family glutamic-type intramembrane protease [Chitinophagaceae bacterium]
MLSLVTLALAPGIAIACYIYSKDKYDREPVTALVAAFILGAISIIPAIVVQLGALSQLGKYANPTSLKYYFLWAFVVVALSEEGAKYLVLRFYAYNNKAFNEPLDGIVYAVMISMGFATVENVMYVVKGGYAAGLLRMFLSVPAHAAFAVLMGYHVGMAKFNGSNAIVHMLKGLLLAVFFHGAFDFFLFLQNNPNVTKYVSTSFLAACTLVTYIIGIRMALKSIRLHQELSKQEFFNTL